MPQGNGASRDTVEKILRLEASTGYRDAAVTCGLEAFVERNLADALSVVAGYRDAGHFDRQQMIARLREYLESGGLKLATEEPYEIELTSPVSTADGVGPKRATVLSKLGVKTLEDLLLYLPRRLEDRSRFEKIGSVVIGQEVAVRGEILAIDQVRVSRQMTVIKAAIGDGTGFLYAVWFNQPWLAQQLRRGEQIDVFGKVEQSHRELQMRSPVWEPAETGMDVGRVVPIYPAAEGITDKTLRSLISRLITRCLSSVTDVLPVGVRTDHALLSRQEAIATIHRPPDASSFEQARRSLAFEELFLLQFGLLATRGGAGVVHSRAESALVDTFLAQLPFALTNAQRAALREIEGELAKPVRMMRLLQGDVGSGKTLVAVVAALHAIDAGFQVALMAPTEILAEQHALSLEPLLKGLPVRAALITGSTKEKETLKAQTASGEVDLLIGTHALIQETVSFESLGLVIIDEQHRFGVVQRSLIEEKGEQVDLLVMSATPIPRTIALTLYGEFDVTVLDELPLGPKRIATHWAGESRRSDIYTQVGALLAKGGKGYVVLPLVEESDKIEANAAVQVAEELTVRFPDIGVGLLHGRMSQAEKAAAMETFRAGRVQLLVSTTVIEVGIDVLDADFMVIEHADRFGLSQLHQLRGRIGRAGQRATCFAIADARSDDAKLRLKAFTEYLDGFAIAEEDLIIRGPGDLLGTQQHGFLNQLRAVDLIEDLDLMRQARSAAKVAHEDGPSVELVEAVEHRFGEVLRWLRV